MEKLRQFMKKISELYKKYKQIILYIFFGVCTTVVNVASYEILYMSTNISNLTSTIIAWLVAVLFAFITNKKYVFNSKSDNLKDKFHKFVSFFVCRGMTGILDVIIMAVAVDYLKLHSLLWKLISNIIVTIINYVTSKLFIFKNLADKTEH